MPGTVYLEVYEKDEKGQRFEDLCQGHDDEDEFRNKTNKLRTPGRAIRQTVDSESIVGESQHARKVCRA